MDYDGSERTTQRAVAATKAAFERPAARLPALGSRARSVVPVGLGNGPADLGAADAAVVRVAVVEPLSRHHPDMGQDTTDSDRMSR